MSKKLAIVKPAAINLPATQPPPRKEDIINAMVERARVKHAEESKALQEKRNAAEKEFFEALTVELAAHPERFERRTIGISWSSPEVEFRLRIMSPELKRLQSAALKIPQMSSFDSAATKKRIREGMNTAGDRVKALLTSPVAVKALDQALEQIIK